MKFSPKKLFSCVESLLGFCRISFVKISHSKIALNVRRMMAKKERKVKVKVKRMKTTVGKKMEKKKRRKEKKLARIKLMRRLLLLARIEMWSFESSRGEMNLPCFCQF